MDMKQFNNLHMIQGNGDLFAAMEQNKVDTFNQSQGEDDGTGIQCDICNKRGNRRNTCFQSSVSENHLQY